MADPFDFSGSGSQIGSPEFFRNLMLFGGALSTAANARDGRGFLTYGNGFAGPFGAAVGQTAQTNMDMAKNQASTQYTKSQLQGQNLLNYKELLQLPALKARAAQQEEYFRDPKAYNEKYGLNQSTDMSGLFAQPSAGQPSVAGGAAPSGAVAANGIPIPPRGVGGPGVAASAPTEWLPFYQKASAETGIPVDLLIAQSRQESSFNPNAKGKAGEIGLMQILPSTAAKPGFGIDGIDPAKLTDPETNIMFGARYLKARMGNGNPNDPAAQAQALAAYNGGGDPNYVANVFRYRPGLAPSDPAGNVATYQPPAPAATVAPFQVAQAGNGPIPMPSGGTAPQQPVQQQPLPQAPMQQRPAQAPVSLAPPPQMAQSQGGVQPQFNITPQAAFGISQRLLAQANAIEQQRGFGIPASGDPAALRQQAHSFLQFALTGPTTAAQEAAKLPYAGQIAAAQAQATLPTELAKQGYQITPNGQVFIPGSKADPGVVGREAAAKAAAEAPFQYLEVRPGGVLAQGGAPVMQVPILSDEAVLEGPNAGVGYKVFRNPLDGSVVGGTPGAAGDTGNGMPAGAVPTKLSPVTEGRQRARGEVEGQDLQHDRKIIEEDLSHVVENVLPAKQQLYQLRSLIGPAQTGAAGEFRAELKNWVQTFAPEFVSQITGDASPAQEFKKVALMGAGKQERGDLGARGGFRAIEMYVKANPNLDMQPNANRDMANALLVSHQMHEDYVTGASDHYMKQRAGFMDPEKPQGYTPVAAYDRKFVQMMRPELYASAISAVNGKSYAEWSKGLTPKQQLIVGGIIQRADPNAVIDIDGFKMPVAKLNNIIGPTQLMEAAGAR